MTAGVGNELLNQSSPHPPASPALCHIDVPEPGKSIRRLIGIKTDRADPNQLVTIESAEEQLARIDISFFAVQPLLAQPMEETAVVGFVEEVREQPFGISDWAKLPVHPRSTTARSNTLSNIAGSSRPVFWL